MNVMEGEIGTGLSYRYVLGGLKCNMILAIRTNRYITVIFYLRGSIYISYSGTDVIGQSLRTDFTPCLCKSDNP